MRPETVLVGETESVTIERHHRKSSNVIVDLFKQSQVKENP
ncbi:hypothetical protein ACK2E9_01600 [Bifidobacterium catenulatum]|nr:hypothetical protein [Bifidobacterium catenulatum]